MFSRVPWYPIKNYFVSDAGSLGSIADAVSRGIGAEPSPTRTITLAVLFVVVPLAAEITPASIRLARAAMIVFFTVQNLLLRFSWFEQTVD